MGAFRRSFALPLLSLLLLMTLASAGSPQAPASASYSIIPSGGPSFGGPVDLAPSNPLGMPGSAYGAPQGSGSITFCPQLLEGILPRIPNLEFGYQYGFGNRVSTGRFTFDYRFPVNFGTSAVAFGEVHSEFQNFWKTLRSLTITETTTTSQTGIDDRLDFSAGGGFRKLFGESTLLGLNAFYDGSRIAGQWYSSGSLGFEMAAILPGKTAIDANFNWYGNLFNWNTWVNAFRNFGGSYDFEVGYSHPMLEETLDLRLKAAGYQFDVGSKVYGSRVGADLTTRDGMFSVRYEYGSDAINGSYNTIGGFVNVGLQLENLLSGASPVTMPQPVFVNPRNPAWMLTQKVKRNWHQPSVVSISSCGGRCNTTRFIPAMTISGLGVGNRFRFFFLNRLFDEVPVSCLQSGKWIRVSFHYRFTENPGNAYTDRVGVQVWGTAPATSNRLMNSYYPWPDSQEGDVDVLLNTSGTPVPGQDAFITTGDNPDRWASEFYRRFSGSPTPTTVSVGLTNIVIYFNQ